jgi:peptidyl-tRNA hydrolase
MTKQVIIIRRDLKMRRGKEIAQGSHASMAFMSSYCKQIMHGIMPIIPDHIKDWINNSFTKVTLQVDSEEQIKAIYDFAKESGIEANLIVDSGRTEFNGVPTITALALGPDDSSKIDAITGSEGKFPLKLY